jgi:hypothetical protein
MAGPGDEIAAAAAGLGCLRASRADRERVIDALKAAFVQDRLTKDEFEARIGQVLTSRTYAELAAVTADIPVRMAEPRPAPVRKPGRVRPRRPVNYVVKWFAYGFITPAVITVAVAVASSSGNAVIAVMVLFAFLYLMVWVPTSQQNGPGGVPGGKRPPRPRPPSARG